MVESPHQINSEEESKNRNKKMVFRVKFENVNVIKKIFHALARITDEMVFHITEESLTITAYKPINRVYAHITISPEDTLLYECNEEITISFSLKKYNKILKRTERIANTIELSYTKRAPSIAIIIEKLYKHKGEIDPTFSLNLYNKLPEFPPELYFTQLSFDIALKVDWKELYDSLTDARVYHEIANLCFKENILSISSSNEIGESKAIFANPELIKGAHTSIESRYNIGLLKKIVSVYTRTENAKLEFSEHSFLQFHGEFENGSTFEWYLRNEDPQNKPNASEQEKIPYTEGNILEMFKDRGRSKVKERFPKERSYLKPAKAISPETFIEEFKDTRTKGKRQIQTNFTNSLNTVKSRVNPKKTEIRKRIRAKCIDKFEPSSSQ